MYCCTRDAGGELERDDLLGSAASAIQGAINVVPIWNQRYDHSRCNHSRSMVLHVQLVATARMHAGSHAHPGNLARQSGTLMPAAAMHKRCFLYTRSMSGLPALDDGRKTIQGP